MDPIRKARRGTGGVALVALLLVALATLAASPSGASTSVVPHGGHSTRALDALRTVSVSVLHHAPIDRAPSDPTTAATTTGLSARLLVALVQRASHGAVAPRAPRVWWGGRCWRAPPAVTTA